MKDPVEIYLKTLHSRLDKAVASAMPLVANAEFDEAERMIFEVDGDVFGKLAAANMYINAILSSDRSIPKNKSHIRILFDRAVRLRENAYPTPHTAMEAELYREGSSQQRDKIVQELGFNPTE